MDTPKPKPPVHKKAQQKQTEQVKKANFKLKSHLTHRPFSDEALFAKLRKQAETSHMDKEGDK